MLPAETVIRTPLKILPSSSFSHRHHLDEEGRLVHSVDVNLIFNREPTLDEAQKFAMRPVKSGYVRLDWYLSIEDVGEPRVKCHVVALLPPSSLVVSLISRDMGWKANQGLKWMKGC